MLEAVPLRVFTQQCERRLQALRSGLSSRIIGPLELHRKLCGLEQAYELAKQLLSHDFDEVYVLPGGGGYNI